MLQAREYTKEGSQKTLAYTEKGDCLFLCPCPNSLRLASRQGVGGFTRGYTGEVRSCENARSAPSPSSQKMLFISYWQVHWLSIIDLCDQEKSSSSSSSCSWRVRHVILFLDPQDEVNPSISSSVVLCFFFLLVYIVVLVLVVCLCPSSVHVVATFPGTVLFPLLCYVLQFFA